MPPTTAATANPPLRPFTLHASTLARAHTYLAYTAFFGALLIGCALHYKKIVKNGVAGYPEEWIPSVSATIGDWYPERNIFQILIAVNSGPRFALVALQCYLQRTPQSSIPGFLLLVGILRTLSCGGWVYITSSDDHDVHDVLMISYIVLNLPWMFGSIAFTPASHVASRRRRRFAAFSFFAAIVPMVYFFIQHKVHRVPGAYTRYSFFEWALILLDVWYDSAAELDFKAADLKITVGTLVGGTSEADKIAVSEAAAEVPPASLASVADKSAEKSIEQSVEGVSVAPSKQSMLARARPTITFTSDIYLSYVFWSVYTALVPTLFYFSVWELGISGQELALLATLSPALLGIAPLWDWARAREGRAVLHGLTLVGLAAYVNPSPLGRLFLVAFASAAAMLGATVDWLGAQGEEVLYQAFVAGLGFFLTSIAKHANHSNNPVWPFVDGRSGGYNKTGIALALLAILEFASRPTPSPTPTPAPEKPAKTSTPAPSQHWLPASLALGSLLFSIHSLVGDGSTLIAWSWTGYPIRGPVPNVHGSLTHVAQALGLGLAALLSSAPSAGRLRAALTHPLWLAAGAGSAYVMYAYRDWAGYAGGLGTAFFLMSVLPAVWARAAEAGRGREARTVALACLVMAVFVVVSTFTVAYAFVPGGQVFRERTDAVLVAQFALLALAFDWRLPRRTPTAPSPAPHLPRAAHYKTQYTLVLFTALSLLASLWRTSWPAVTPVPHREAARIVRAGIWTVHFGIDNEGRDSQRRMRDLIRDMELDVVGLLETDLHRIPFGNRDLTRVIAEELGYFVDIGPGPNQHTWGAVLLSKFPILNTTHHLLPSPDGELAPAIEAVLDMFGVPVTVVVSHNGQEETPLDRELQSIELARIMAEAAPRPVIFLGYVVTKPHAPRPAPYDIMVTDGRVHDIDSDDYDRWCEYIFYRGLYRTAYARISRSTITDTELQVGQFVVPRDGAGVVDDSHEARYMRAWKEELPEDHWFPMEYYQEVGGVRGHFYHVFNTPLYYKIPEGAKV
ncbi:Frag1/DRAM/Sfk1 family-domain-containing protein [Trametes polyzona]|nr:Frag1/DRAM/Sfk1 family-domain-containing protein [Trametes polyzona]